MNVEVAAHRIKVRALRAPAPGELASGTGEFAPCRRQPEPRGGCGHLVPRLFGERRLANLELVLNLRSETFGERDDFLLQFDPPLRAQRRDEIRLSA